MKGAAGIPAIFILLAALTGCGDRIQPPNVLLITIDTLRPDRLGAYGNVNALTPQIDRLAREGALFLDATSVSAWTLPSMASIMTSAYPARHGAFRVDRQIDSTLPTLAETLGGAGYTTAGVHGHLLVSSLYGFDKGFDHLVELGVNLNDANAAWEEANNPSPNQPTADEINAAAREWLSNDPPEPFFLWVHYFDPHLPYKPPGRFLGAFDSSPPDRITLNGRPPQKYFRAQNPMPEGLRQRILGLYDGEIHAVDRAVGELLQAYYGASTGEAIVVLTSDHGEEFKEHGRLNHTKTLYDELLRVPLVVAGPHIEPGSRVASQAQNVDIFPTILKMLQIEKPAGLHGRALTFSDEDGSPRETQLSETRNRSWSDSAGVKATGANPLFLRSVRQGPWKMIVSLLDDRKELYFLPDDPAELMDVAAANGKVIDRLTRILDEKSKRGGPFTADSMAAGQDNLELNDEQVERLRALGYIQ